jgi:hypothetical protein
MRLRYGQRAIEYRWQLHYKLPYKRKTSYSRNFHHEVMSKKRLGCSSAPVGNPAISLELESLHGQERQSILGGGTLQAVITINPEANARKIRRTNTNTHTVLVLQQRTEPYRANVELRMLVGNLFAFQVKERYKLQTIVIPSLYLTKVEISIDISASILYTWTTESLN